jgi:hypothetical protein
VTTKEYMEAKIQQLIAKCDRLTMERDEARREVCRNESHHLPTMSDPYREAERRGWDCFKEDGNG